MSDTPSTFTHMDRWHPWRHAGEQHTNVIIDCTQRLTDGTMGLLGDNHIWLDRRLTQAERRCTLTHELLHVEHPDAGETEIEYLTAQRLITTNQLVDAFKWSPHPTLEELAEHWWVDQQTAWTRMNNLDPLEVAELEHATDGDWSWCPNGWTCDD